MSSKISDLTNSPTIENGTYIPSQNGASNYKIPLKTALDSYISSISTNSGVPNSVVKTNSTGDISAAAFFITGSPNSVSINTVGHIYSNGTDNVSLEYPQVEEHGGVFASQAWASNTFVPLSGGTLTGPIIIPKIKKTSGSLSWSSTLTFDFDNVNEWIIVGTMTGDTAIQTTNRAIDKELSIVFVADGATRLLSFVENWIWLGSNTPSELDAGKRAILSLRCIGSASTDILAAWTVQP